MRNRLTCALGATWAVYRAPILVALLIGLAIAPGRPGRAFAQTSNKATVADFSPVGEAGLRSNITVTFSRPLMPADSLDRPVENPPIIITIVGKK